MNDEFAVVQAEWHESFSGAAWSPPKRLLLDEVKGWIDVDGYVEAVTAASGNSTSGRGEGVTIGIVDGAIDLRHPDLRNEEGSTRAAWFLDFGSPPLGLHPELEEEYGCTDAGATCAIWAASDIDVVLSGAPTSLTLPLDRLGHGTHVASVAAGNGRASGRYVGVAPNATLIVTRLADDGFEVQDANVLLASRFVFERAAELGQPAVVNLSLGGDFGPHDGNTTLERALVSLLDEPGRVMVVAAGNSGQLVDDGPDGLTGPFGIHTDVFVKGEREVFIALPEEQDSFDGDILVWLDTQPGESLAVGLAAGTDTIIDWVQPGESADGSARRWDALVSNRAPLDDGLQDLAGGTLLLVTGQFEAQEVLTLKLSGDARAALWLQGAGELSLGSGTRGPAFALARQGGTITVPATAPELIAVGATLNRDVWPSRAEGTSRLSLFSEQLDETPGSVAFFSSVGPNHAGHLKPDVLAPGALVIGAMARSADPRPPGGSANAVSLFGSSPACEEEPVCAVVDDDYAIAMGTSMAAPAVAGAAALLLEQNPRLTQGQVRAVLTAGVSRQRTSKATASWERSLVAASGSLALGRAWQALQLTTQTPDASVTVSETESWLTFADAYVAPGETIEFMVWARTEANDPADVDLDALKVSLSNGKRVGDLERVAPGLFRGLARADADAPLGAGQHLEVRVRRDDVTLASAAVPIAGDMADVRGIAVAVPPRLNEETCGLSPGRPERPPWLWLSALTLAAGLRSGRRSSRARRRSQVV